MYVLRFINKPIREYVMSLETNKKILGEKFKKYRKNLGLTQFQLAERVGLNEKQISRIEAGLNYPTYTTLAKLIEVLEINVLDFLSAPSEQINHSQEELIKLIKKSNDLEIKIYYDVLKALRKNIKTI